MENKKTINIDVEDLTCPITQSLFLDPVMTCDGHTYEHDAIIEWFKKHNTSPMSNIVLIDKNFIPNITMKKLVETFIKTYPNEAPERYEKSQNIENKVKNHYLNLQNNNNNNNEYTGQQYNNPNVKYLIDDSILENQYYACISFFKDAVKIRGTFRTISGAQERARNLQINDPNHSIYIGEVGKWLAKDTSIDNSKYNDKSLQETIDEYKKNIEKGKHNEEIKRRIKNSQN
jgi:hypothetical protein